MNPDLRSLLAEEQARVAWLRQGALSAQGFARHTRESGQHAQVQRDAYAAARGKAAGWAEAHARLRSASAAADQTERERDEARAERDTAREGWSRAASARDIALGERDARPAITPEMAANWLSAYAGALGGAAAEQIYEALRAHAERAR
jgi:hypothetical protein